MKYFRTTLFSVAAIMFSASAFADEKTDRFVAACVADGDTQAVCTCTAQAMQATFSEAQFDQIVTITESGDHDAGAQLFQAIFAAQPELVAALNANKAACQ